MSRAYAGEGLHHHYQLQRETESRGERPYQGMSYPVLTEEQRRLRRERFWNLPPQRPISQEAVNDEKSESDQQMENTDQHMETTDQHMETADQPYTESSFSSTAYSLRCLAYFLKDVAAIALLCLSMILYYLFMLLRLPFLCHVFWNLPWTCRLRSNAQSTYDFVMIDRPQTAFWSFLVLISGISVSTNAIWYYCDRLEDPFLEVKNLATDAFLPASAFVAGIFLTYVLPRLVSSRREILMRAREMVSDPDTESEVGDCEYSTPGDFPVSPMEKLEIEMKELLAAKDSRIVELEEKSRVDCQKRQEINVQLADKVEEASQCQMKLQQATDEAIVEDEQRRQRVQFLYDIQARGLDLYESPANSSSSLGRARWLRTELENALAVNSDLRQKLRSDQKVSEKLKKEDADLRKEIDELKAERDDSDNQVWSMRRAREASPTESVIWPDDPSMGMCLRRIKQLEAQLSRAKLQVGWKKDEIDELHARLSRRGWKTTTKNQENSTSSDENAGNLQAGEVQTTLLQGQIETAKNREAVVELQAQLSTQVGGSTETQPDVIEDKDKQVSDLQDQLTQSKLGFDSKEKDIIQRHKKEVEALQAQLSEHDRVHSTGQATMKSFEKQVNDLQAQLAQRDLEAKRVEKKVIDCHRKELGKAQARLSRRDEEAQQAIDKATDSHEKQVSDLQARLAAANKQEMADRRKEGSESRPRLLRRGSESDLTRDLVRTAGSHGLAETVKEYQDRVAELLTKLNGANTLYAQFEECRYYYCQLQNSSEAQIKGMRDEVEARVQAVIQEAEVRSNDRVQQVLQHAEAQAAEQVQKLSMMGDERIRVVRQEERRAADDRHNFALQNRVASGTDDVAIQRRMQQLETEVSQWQQRGARAEAKYHDRERDFAVLQARVTRLQYEVDNPSIPSPTRSLMPSAASVAAAAAAQRNHKLAINGMREKCDELATQRNQAHQQRDSAESELATAQEQLDAAGAEILRLEQVAEEAIHYKRCLEAQKMYSDISRDQIASLERRIESSPSASPSPPPRQTPHNASPPSLSSAPSGSRKILTPSRRRRPKRGQPDDFEEQGQGVADNQAAKRHQEQHIWDKPEDDGLDDLFEDSEEQ